MTSADGSHGVILTELHEVTRRMMAAESTDDVARIIQTGTERLLGDATAAVYAGTADGPLERLGDTDPEPDLADRCRELAEEALETTGTAARVVVGEDDGTPCVAYALDEHGALVVSRPAGGRFTEEDVELARILATNGVVALDRAEQLDVLREREAALVDERNRLAALFENIPSPTASFVVEDGEPIVESVNPAFEDVFGYDEADLVGERIDDYIVPSGMEPEATRYNDLLLEGSNVNVEVRRLTATGPRDFLLDVVPFRLNEPNVHGYAMYTDITNRKQREQELERQNERLEEFANIVSHDIRNPLNVAQGFLDLARENPEAAYFDRVDDALERVDTIVESVLTLAREGRTITDRRPVDLGETARTAWRNVATGDATLVVEPSVDRHVAGDRSRLTTLFENLFRNARDHVDDDVTITVGRLETDAGFYVEDDGPGIDEQLGGRVFESGFTTHESGTGFGLAIVTEVAEAHDWSIELGDQTAGARFEVRGVDWVDPDTTAAE